MQRDLAGKRKPALLSDWPAAVARVILWLALGLTHQRCLAANPRQDTRPSEPLSQQRPGGRRSG